MGIVCFIKYIFLSYRLDAFNYKYIYRRHFKRLKINYENNKNSTGLKGMTFDHEFANSFSISSSLFIKERREKGKNNQSRGQNSFLSVWSKICNI